MFDQKVKIEKVEDGFVFLKFEDGQVLKWSEHNFLGEQEVGSEVVISLLGSQESEEEKDKIAKNILNQILS